MCQYGFKGLHEISLFIVSLSTRLFFKLWTISVLFVIIWAYRKSIKLNVHVHISFPLPSIKLSTNFTQI